MFSVSLSFPLVQPSSLLPSLCHFGSFIMLYQVLNLYGTKWDMKNEQGYEKKVLWYVLRYIYLKSLRKTTNMWVRIWPAYFLNTIWFITVLTSLGSPAHGFVLRVCGFGLNVTASFIFHLPVAYNSNSNYGNIIPKLFKYTILMYVIPVFTFVGNFYFTWSMPQNAGTLKHADTKPK